MTDPVTISEEEYRAEIKELAGIAAGYAEESASSHPGLYDSPEAALLDVMNDVLDGHEWLIKNRYREAAYGSIIEHAGEEFHPYRDLSTLTDTDNVTELLKRIAGAYLEVDVIEAAREMLAED